MVEQSQSVAFFLSCASDDFKIGYFMYITCDDTELPVHRIQYCSQFLCHSMLCWVFDDLVVNKKDMLKTKDVASLVLQTFKQKFAWCDDFIACP